MSCSAVNPLGAESRSATIAGEISALTAFTSANAPAKLAAVSTWSNQIFLYRLDDGAVPLLQLSEAFYAVSLLLKPPVNSSSAFPSAVQLLAGLSDGSMVTYDIAIVDSAASAAMTGRKASSLGTRPLRLCEVSGECEGDQMLAVGLSERISLVFEAKDRIDFSSVSRKVCLTSRSCTALIAECRCRSVRSRLSGAGHIYWIAIHQGYFPEEAACSDSGPRPA